MQLSEGKQYLTRCKLTVTILEREPDSRDNYPYLGQFENGPSIGNTDFWMEDGNFHPGEDHQMDLVKEL